MNLLVEQLRHAMIPEATVKVPAFTMIVLETVTGLVEVW